MESSTEEIYQQTAEQKGVQAIFCDIAVNSDDGRFSVYDYIKEELVRRGIPENEICTAGDAETQKQRNEMYAQLRSGTKRIVLASTSKMGTGANIQTKLAALHNLDIPWKPSDVEHAKRHKGQPIIRQMALFFLHKPDSYANMKNDQRRNHLSLVVCSISNLLNK